MRLKVDNETPCECAEIAIIFLDGVSVEYSSANTDLVWVNTSATKCIIIKYKH